MNAPSASRPFTVALAQTPLAWHDAVANRAAFDALLAPLAGQVDLVVLPEMFTTGFTMEPAAVAELPGGETQAWMQRQARLLDAAITGSHVCRDGEHHYNRLLWATPDGGLRHYDKRHLFRMAGEHQRYAAGREALVVPWRGMRCALQVCYDLRFPVWSRRRPEFDYDVLVYVANWPAPRREAWRALLVARAIENQCYVVGVNRVGKDGTGLDYSGDSLVVDPRGRLLADAGATDGIVTAQLDRPALHEFRDRFPAHLDADRFTLAP
jgi:predicted amidohydrolase